MVGLYCGLAFLVISSFVGWRIRRSYVTKQEVMEDYTAFLDFAKRKMLSKKGGENNVFAEFIANKVSLIPELKTTLEGNSDNLHSAPNDGCAREILTFWRGLRSVDYVFLEDYFAEHIAFSAAETDKKRKECAKYGALYSKLGVLIGCLLLILLL